jgi:hypothetical protein
MEESKPKRVLTEAQRLAFLKGREKRMANIEKKRLEKLESSSSLPEAPVVIPDVPPKLQVPDVPEPSTVIPDIPTPPPPPPPAAVVSIPPTPTPFIDEGKLANDVADLVFRKMQENKPKRKPREKKVTIVEEVKETTPSPQQPSVSRFVNNFSWL